MNNMAIWTKEQLQAINSDGCSVIVSAAAGSGKTSVLVERLLRILSDNENKVSADKMIVVTFTKNSASEMKQRLIKAITQKIEQEPNNDWLIKQHSMLQSAKISTIHSFCFDLIKDNINNLDISTGFKIIEPNEEKILCLKVIKEVIEETYKTNPQEMEFLSQSICDKTDDDLENLILNLYEFLMSVPFFQDWLKTKCIDYYSKNDMFNDEALNSVFKYEMDILKECLNWNNRAIELCEDAEDDKCLNILQVENSMLLNAIDILNTSEKYDISVLGELANYKFQRISFSKDNDYRDAIKLYRDTYKDLFTSNKINFTILKDVIENYSQDKATNKRISVILADLINSTHTELNALKAEENVLGFSDAEQIAINLLAKKDDNGNIVKTELAESLSNYYEIIMIDEFQDSNNNQDLIFKMISKGGTAERMGSNMFVVGDVKQSIYNFRLANPQNFINAMEYSKPYTEENPPQNSYIKLNKNFRSSMDVIEFVNYIFENIMSEEAGEVIYNDSEKLIYGANYPVGDRSTEIPIIDTEKFSEADYVADTIKYMIDNKHQVVERDGSIRDCKPNDFCLLFMSTKDVPTYFEKLQERGLSADFDQDEEFLKSREVSLLMNMIKVVDNPMDNISLISVMMSPMFMFNPDEISIIRLSNRDVSMYSAILKISEDVNFERYSKELVTKIQHLIDTINRLRNLSANCTTYQLMSSIIDMTDFISIMQVYDTSTQRRENIQIFLKIAQNHDDTSTTGIAGFIRYINSMLDNKEDIIIKKSTSVTDSVSIKTIHKSKGLEFPFVFLCNVDKKFNEKDTFEVILKNFNHGLAYKLKDRTSLLEYTTVDRIRISNDKRLELRSEKLRLMYVALTRAKEKLFIPLSLNQNEVKSVTKYIDTIQYENRVPSYLVKTSIYMRDWLLMALCCCDKAQPLRDFFGLPKDNTIKCNANLNMYIYNPSEERVIESINDTSNEEVFTINEPLKSEVLRRCNFEYVNQKADLPARISVSDIVKSDNVKISEKVVKNLNVEPSQDMSNDENSLEEIYNDLRTPDFMNFEYMSPAERGTAIHRVMQYCDFNKLKLDINTEIDRLIYEGYITKEQSKVVDYSMFANLIQSDIFELISNNKIQRERDFLVKVSELNLENQLLDIYKDTDTMLQGCVDMIVFQPDGITIIDYKTDNVRNINILKDRYSLQVQLYKSAIELVENIKVKRSLIYSMKLGKSIEI